jgi:hypothetical protein
MPITCEYDQARLAALLRVQYGVIARWQALECGLTSRAIEYRIRHGGPWRAMLPGVYLTVTGVPTPEQRDMAALLQRRRCTLPMLIDELNEGPSGGSRSLRMALAEVSDGVRSKAEADLRNLIDRSDLEKPLYNARLYTQDGIFIAKPDAWWQRAGVAGEVDSREYHIEAADYRATVMRHNQMERYGINVQHWLPSVIANEPRTVLSDLRMAIDSGCRRPPLPIVTMIDE